MHTIHPLTNITTLGGTILYVINITYYILTSSVALVVIYPILYHRLIGEAVCGDNIWCIVEVVGCGSQVTLDNHSTK